MKKIIIATLLLAPAFTFAFGDSVSINQITPTCGVQDIDVVVNATYGNNNRHLVTYLDGQKLNHYNSEPASVTETINVGIGAHKFEARIYLIEWNKNNFSIKLASRSKNFTVNECQDEGDDEDTGGEEEPPVDEEEEEVPTDESEITTEEVRQTSSSGTTINFRLCFLSGNTVCIPYGLETKEMIPYMVQLADLFYERNQLQLDNK